MDRWINRFLSVLLVYIIHVLDPGLTVLAMVLTLPWMTEGVDRFLGRVYNLLFQFLRLPRLLRQRLTVALIYWPTLIKGMDILLYWLLLEYPEPASRSRILLAAVLVSLVLSGVLVFTTAREIQVEGRTRLLAQKRLGYNLSRLAVGVYALVAVIALWLTDGSWVAVVAMAVIAVTNAPGYFGLSYKLVQVKRALNCLLLMYLLDPGAPALVLVAVMLLAVLLVTFRQAFQQGWRQYRCHVVYKRVLNGLDPGVGRGLDRQRLPG